MRVFLNLLYKALGREYLSIIVNSFLIIIAILVFYYFIKRGITKTVMVVIPVILSLFWLFHLERPEERIHFIEYGILGVLVFKALGKGFKKIIIAILFILLTGTLDEIIQFILPNRVGDIRDIIFNVIGGSLGVWMGLFYKSNKDGKSL